MERLLAQMFLLDEGASRLAEYVRLQFYLGGGTTDAADKPREVQLCGKPGTGKSTLCRALSDALLTCPEWNRHLQYWRIYWGRTFGATNVTYFYEGNAALQSAGASPTEVQIWVPRPSLAPALLRVSPSALGLDSEESRRFVVAWLQQGAEWYRSPLAALECWVRRCGCAPSALGARARGCCCATFGFLWDHLRRSVYPQFAPPVAGLECAVWLLAQRDGAHLLAHCDLSSSTLATIQHAYRERQELLTSLLVRPVARLILAY